MTLPDCFEYRPGFLTPEFADHLLDQLWNELEWTRYKIRMFGRQLEQPRLTAWCSDSGIGYSYSGLTLHSEPWYPELDRLRMRLQADLGAGFNSVLVNAYRDGRDSMGWHADDEPELGGTPVIASVSLGAHRRMLVRPKAGGSARGIELENGSLLVMRAGSQEQWMHSVPRTRRPLGLRINLTYRLVRDPDAG